MVCELQIIFGLHPITRKLGIAGQILEFLDHLRGIAAGAAVDAVTAVMAAAVVALRPIATTTIVTATATATALPNVHADSTVPSKVCEKSSLLVVGPHGDQPDPACAGPPPPPLRPAGTK